MVSVGDIFAIAGQSNASGRATNNQTYNSATLFGAMFGNDYAWKQLADPTDSNAGQVDAVSSETGTRGSIWPIIADSIAANQGVPVAIVPCSKGGTDITQWLPDTDHYDRTTLYGSMATRIYSVGGVRAVLWWQGENDAVDGMSAATYNGHLDTIADALAIDLSTKLMPCLLQDCSGIDDAKEAEIRTGTSTAWGDNVNVIEGPDFSDLVSDDSAHLMTDAKIDSCANRFWRKIRDNIYAP